MSRLGRKLALSWGDPTGGLQNQISRLSAVETLPCYQNGGARAPAGPLMHVAIRVAKSVLHTYVLPFHPRARNAPTSHMPLRMRAEIGDIRRRTGATRAPHNSNHI